MKRPVFWAVVMFALGEVTGLFVRTWKELGIAVAVLICVAAIGMLVSKKWIPFLMAFGCAFSAVKSGNYHLFDATARQIVQHLDTETGEEIKATVCGMITRVVENAYTTSYTIKVTDCSISTQKEVDVHSVVGPYILTSIAATKKDAPAIRIGDIVLVEGFLQVIPAPENPGQFDMQKYYLARRIRYKVKPEIVNIIHQRQTLTQAIMDARAYMKACLYATTDDETASLYAGILLGDKTGINKNVKRLFEAAGISHILSISALHISIVAMTLYKLLRRLGASFQAACPCSGILIILYGTLTGWSFSAVRAAIMLGLVLLGELLGRKSDLLTSAAIALFVMSTSSPYMLLDGGVCISFSAIVGIALGQKYSRIFQRSYRERQKKKINRFRMPKQLQYALQMLFERTICALIVTAWISVITAPVLARLYYFVSTYSIVINLIVVPLMTVVVILGLAGMLSACLFLPVGRFLLGLGGRILEMFQAICSLAIRMPVATLRTGKPPIWFLLLYYLVVAGAIGISGKKFRIKMCKVIHAFTYKWLDKKRWYRRLVFIYIVYFMCAGAVLIRLWDSHKKEEIIFLSVGQGDGILLRTKEGLNLVIDGGSTSEDAIAENVLMPAIWSKGMQHVDYWFISHADKDHISGLEAVLELGVLSQITIDYIVVAQAALEDEHMRNIIWQATERNIKIIAMKQGDKLVCNDDFEILCVAPKGSLLQPDNRNEISLCFTYKSDALFALFTGDAEADEMADVAEYIRQYYAREPALYAEDKSYMTIVKVPHHGSKNSCIEGFYSLFDVAIISCGENNIYGHPHVQILELLTQEACIIRRTDIEGAVTICK